MTIASLGWRLFVSMVVMGIACDGAGNSNAPAPCTNSGGVAELELGTGLEEGVEYLSLADGAQVPLMFGQQQGFHVWVHLRMNGVCGNGLRIERLATAKESGRILLSSMEILNVVPAVDGVAAAAGWLQLPASLPTFLCPPVMGEPIIGKPIDLRVRIQDELGRSAETQKTVYPFCPEGPSRSVCLSTCK